MCTFLWQCQKSARLLKFKPKMSVEKKSLQLGQDTAPLEN